MLTKLFLSLMEVSVITGAVIFALVLLSSRLNRNYAAKWKYWVWLILAVRLLIPVNISLSKAPVQIAVPQTQIDVPMYAQPTDVQPSDNTQFTDTQAAGTEQQSGQIQQTLQAQQTPASAPSEHPASVSFTLAQIIMLAWLAGFLLFVVHQLIAYRLFRRQALRWSRPVLDSRITGEIKLLCTQMKIRRQIHPVISAKVSGPMMTGFAKPLLLLPGEDYSDTELAFILKHELTHFKRRDLWYKLLMLFVNAVHWFNPLVYLMFREAGNDLELSCDDEVTKGATRENRKLYGETILNSIGQMKCGGTALSTGFDGSTKMMKKRIRNIFSNGKKRRGVLALCAVLALVCMAGGLIACRQNPAKAAESMVSSNDVGSGTESARKTARTAPAEDAESTARTIPAQTVTSGKKSTQTFSSGPADAGNTYTFDGNKLSLSYHNGKTTAEVDLPPTTDHYRADEQTGVWMSDQITALVYSKSEANVSVIVIVSRDRGKTWNTYTVNGTNAISETDTFTTERIGFTSKNDGWLILDGCPACGTQRHYIFETADGGKTWKQIGDTNDFYPRVLAGAGFANKDIGFLCFRRESEETPAPTIYRTLDRGKTWEKISLPVPKEYQDNTYGIVADSPVFDGAKGVMPVTVSSIKQTVHAQYVTSDYGKTWTYKDSSTQSSK